MDEAAHDMAARKAAARRELLLRRRARPETEVHQAGLALAAHAAGEPVFTRARAIAVYLSMRGEPPTEALIADRLAARTRIIVPAAHDDGSLAWHAYDPAAATRRSRLGVDEPEGEPLPGEPLPAVDLVVLPALAVDHCGYRLGRGAGYYDRALAGLPTSGPRPLTCAVVFADELLPEVPREPHDEAVDLVLTESGLFRPADTQSGKRFRR
ncbi:MAG: 5-formyltetrahydrofolate cyclo-ligase [Aeromicrobium sp.]|uniref:5-formyltetrahydrofolate cyclo-ligase n=1 Tax=Aeromicrobium sp. TaxID=1871063 RepID=UPI0039E57F80